VRQVNAAFAAVVVAAVLAGGVTATDFGMQLRTIDTIGVVEGQLDSTVTALRVDGGELRLTVRLANPTGYAIDLRGTFVRVFHDGPNQIAYGAGQRADDGPTRLPPRGSLSATYVVGLSPDQAQRLRSAVREGPVRLTVFHSMALRGEPFELARTNVTVTGEVSG
jgi:hypothetical protein